jgi:hypothetical protein
MRIDAGTESALDATSYEHWPDVQGTAQSFAARTCAAAERRSAVKMVEVEIILESRKKREGVY